MTRPRRGAGSRPRGKARADRAGAALWWALILVPLLVLVAYGHTLPYEYQLDDFHAIRDNPSLDHPGDLGGIWHHRPSRFVLYLSFALNIAVTGRSVVGLRAVNLLIHAAAALLVGLVGAMLARRLAPPGGEPGRSRGSPWARAGLIAALLFAAHPIATQAVTYLVQRTASLAALLELAAVALYLRARESRRTATWAASWTCGLLAALTKEMSVALPLAILAIEWTLRRRRDAGDSAAAPRAAWFAPYLLIWPLVAVTAQLPSAEVGIPAAGLRETADIPRVTYLLTQAVVVPRYLGLIAWPSGQNADPDVPLHPGPDGAVLAGLGLLALLTAGAWWARRRQPLVWLGWIWFLITLLPESSVFPISDVMFEHRVYLPLAGIAWGAGALLSSLGAGRRTWLLPATIVVALTVTTHLRNRVWRDELTLWSDVTRKAPGKARGFVGLGVALEKRGRLEEAEGPYRRAIQLDPRDPEALNDLGRLYGRRGRFEQALPLQLEATRLKPEAANLFDDLGTTCWGLGDTARAAAAYRRAIEIATRESETSPRGALVLPVARHAAANLERMRAGGLQGASGGR